MRDGPWPSLDTHRGIYRVAVIGTPAPWERELDRVYAEKYQVGRNRITFCIVSAWDRGYCDGHSAGAYDVIERKCGVRFRFEALSDAIREHMRTHDLDDERRKDYEE